MAADEPATDAGFEALLRYLAATRGFDFSAYKRSTLERRTLVRMQGLGIASFRDYIDYLEVVPEEFERLFNTVLINVTSFFRDAPAWELLRERIIPAILQAKAPTEPVRIWSAACASGEEAYSLAILLAEAMGREQAIERAKIYATDIDEEALTAARNGLYSERAVEDVPVELRERYFEANGDRLAFRRDLRRLVIFGRHDLLRDAPISRIDLLVCRNALMYFNAESQSRILDRFFFALREGGYLFLGKPETLLARANEVTPVDLKLRLFQKTGPTEMRSRLLSTAQNGYTERRSITAPPGERIRETAFDVDMMAQLVTDRDGTVTLVNSVARRLFNLREADVGRPLHDLEVSYRPVDLRSMVERAKAALRPVVVRETSWPLGDGQPRWIDTHAIPLLDEGELIGMKLVFTDVTNYKLLQAELEASHSEIETAYEELQSSAEELETTNEELHSTVEELETTNEELQSTNEELETMNEELSSTNEELQALNEVMQQRSDELDQANGYLTAILSGIGVGVAVLDREMEVRIWNSTAEDQWGLRRDEVVGKHFLNLDIGLPVERLVGCIRQCMSGAESESRETVQARNRRGRLIEAEVVCRPLRVTGTQVLGAILLMQARAPAAEE